MKKTLIKGWHPDIPDVRDYSFIPKITSLPSSVDLRNQSFPSPQIYDQGQLGSCTANGIASLIEYEQGKQNKTTFTPSRLFIYYNERLIENTVKQDNGAQIRDGIKTVATQGVCPETNWTYNISKFKTKPSKTCYNIASKNLVLKYERVEQTMDLIKACLAEDSPIVFGFSVYDYFESAVMAKTGILQLPAKNEKLLGGHCVAIWGYDDSKQMVLVRNSWGTNWGQNGYFWMPYAYLTNTNLSSDFWKITLVE